MKFRVIILGVLIWANTPNCNAQSNEISAKPIDLVDVFIDTHAFFSYTVPSAESAVLP